MKIKYKFSISLFIIGFITTITVFSISYYIVKKYVIAEAKANFLTIAHHASSDIIDIIKERIKIAKTIGSAPVIINALEKSNALYDAMDVKSWKNMQKRLNDRWMKATGENDPFIIPYLKNRAARHLMEQERLLPEHYGELFLTNKYGSMIATTKKLTTLKHSHKYWWIACYNRGAGRVFLDDRGYDESVKGYVLGIVVPVKKNNRIIGILKCNVNIKRLLENKIIRFNRTNRGEMAIVRTGGLILFKEDTKPLSKRIDSKILPILAEKKESIILNDTFTLIYPVESTMGSEDFGFGGKGDSIDHILGNKGEAWHIIISMPVDKLTEGFFTVTELFLLSGIFLIFLMAFSAYLLGKGITRNISSLAGYITNLIDTGLGSKQLIIQSNDEVEVLSEKFNHLISDLHKKETILKEIHHRIKNNLTLISSIISLKQRETDDKVFNNFLEDLISRINSIIIIHEKLYKGKDFVNIEIKQYIEELVFKIVSTFTNYKVKINYNIDKINIHSGMVTSIGLIISELVTNAIKHGFNNLNEGKLDISLKKNGDYCSLIVSNNGTPISKDFTSKESNSLGMKLINSLTKQIKGSLELHTGVETTFEIKFPIKNV